MNGNIQVANAPCSWGVLEFEDMAEPAGPDQVLDEIALSGFAGTELGDWGFLPTNPSALRDAVCARNLALVGAFVPVALGQLQAKAPGIEAALRTAMLLRETGAEGFIVLSDENGSNPHRTQSAGRIGIGDGMSEVGWLQAADTAGAIARAVKDATGLRTVLHHHAAGFIETPDETQRLLDATDPDCLGLCLDTGHWAYGGGDPVTAVHTFGSRIWHVHFKDHDAQVAAQIHAEEEDYFSAVQRGIFCELGQGEVDFSGVLKALQANDYSGWIVVEQDVLPGMGTPLDSAVRNRHFLSRLGL